MPITYDVGGTYQPADPVTEGPSYGTFTYFMQQLMSNPGFGDWLQAMLRNMGYTIFGPGETAPATGGTPPASDVSVAQQGGDPSGANWSQGMTIGSAYPRPQAKPPENEFKEPSNLAY